MEHAAADPNPWMILPFAALLAAMAVGPAFFTGWWLKHYGKVAAALAVVPLVYYLFVLKTHGPVFEKAREYLSFMALIGSLFVVSGGIHVGVKGEATPAVNVVFLLLGAVIANVLGTTGASMLLIRPWIRMNRYRITAHHIVFFIFIVSNFGGCLTPIGDPPLFLGFLQGIPFWWVTAHCWPMWAVGVGLLLLMFYVIDSINFERAPYEVRRRETAREEWRCDGLVNLLFLAAILGAVFIRRPLFVREGLMIAAAIGSYVTTRPSVHEANHFNFHPLREVAILFAGIFATMIPALDWLEGHARALLGEQPAPGLFYWAGGTLSSLLDNAPTYLSFYSALAGVTGTTDAAALTAEHQARIVALSIGSVFFGACTYIGNGPNFLVKSIAEHQKIRTPTFPGYVFRFTLPYLLPVLIVVWALFFRR